MTSLRNGPGVRRTAIAGLVLLAIASLLLVALLPHSPNPGPGPEGRTFEPDKPPLTADGQISDADLAHDSRDDTYRTPFGAVPAGTVVTLRLRAAAGDLAEATARIYDAGSETQLLIPMHVEARDTTAGEHGFDYWAVDLPTTKLPTVLYYRFIVRDGTATRYLEDDQAFDGGPGVVLAESVDASWQIVTYDPGFAAPAWTAGATVYQIFPDRFANGDSTNDPSPDAVPAAEGAGRYQYGDVYGNPILVKGWDELPEGYCRAYQGAATPCTEGPLGRDFFGGDLAGITQHLPELADLGVTVLYLNPIFAAPSNHRYDTSDYLTIDPDLGTREDFDMLLRTAHDLGVRVVLDGVFNHTSSDSPMFDRAQRYAEVGACEAADSPFAAWYTLLPGPPAKCFDGQTYVDWFGFDTLPVLTEDPQVVSFFAGVNGVAPYWVKAGIDGWRLDVMNEISHGVLRALRTAVKTANPDALILGEEWGDASPWLEGTEADGVMNYRFRRAVIGLINGDTADLDGSIAGLSPSAFASAMEGVQEDYPAAAWNSLLNLVDSHDTTRILWTLTPAAENAVAKSDPTALAAGLAKLRQLAALQLTWPGMASIYYGDEVGLSGQDDPDDRRTYPWGNENTDLQTYYRTLATLRRDHEALRTGDLRFLLTDDTNGTLAFGRRTENEAAVTVLNLSDEQQTISVPVAGYLPVAAALHDALSGADVEVGPSGAFSVSVPPRGAAVLLTAAGTDLTPPAAPTTLTADPVAGGVQLDWPDVADAAQYTIWRSVLAGGGFGPVATVTEPRYLDETARPGTAHHYVITAADAAGNAGPRSPEATALPQLTIADAHLEGPGEVAQPLSAVDPGMPIGVLVRVDGTSAAAGPAVGIITELGFGPVDDDPGAETWTWSQMTFAADVDGADRFEGTVRPEATGTWAVALRVSTDGGSTWQIADLDGIGYASAQAVRVDAQPAADKQAPPAPVSAAASVVSDTAVTLIWAPVASDDLFRYEIWRSEGSGAYQRVGVATEATFTDTAVRSGGSYMYVITAQDTSYNRSAYSPKVAAEAASRQVEVTFMVTIPDSTPLGDTIHIAGDFQGWDPGATPMTRVDDVTWTITVTFTEGDQPQYKFTRGSWDAVEKDAGCGEIPNRTITVVYGTDGTLAVPDEVAKWRDVDQCG